MVHFVKGSELSPDAQRVAKAMFTHRYTKEHVPAWARGTNYKPHFADDADWLANTTFALRKDGKFAIKPGYCNSSPTWPDGKGVNGQKGNDW